MKTTPEFQDKPLDLSGGTVKPEQPPRPKYVQTDSPLVVKNKETGMNETTIPHQKPVWFIEGGEE